MLLTPVSIRVGVKLSARKVQATAVLVEPDVAPGSDSAREQTELEQSRGSEQVTATQPPMLDASVASQDSVPPMQTNVVAQSTGKDGSAPSSASTPSGESAPETRNGFASAPTTTSLQTPTAACSSSAPPVSSEPATAQDGSVLPVPPTRRAPVNHFDRLPAVSGLRSRLEPVASAGKQDGVRGVSSPGTSSTGARADAGPNAGVGAATNSPTGATADTANTRTASTALALATAAKTTGAAGSDTATQTALAQSRRWTMLKDPKGPE